MIPREDLEHLAKELRLKIIERQQSSLTSYNVGLIDGWKESAWLLEKLLDRYPPSGGGIMELQEKLAEILKEIEQIPSSEQRNRVLDLTNRLIGDLALVTVKMQQRIEDELIKAHNRALEQVALMFKQ